MEVGEKSPWAEGDISIHNSSFSTRKQWPVNLSAMISSVILTADEDKISEGGEGLAGEKGANMYFLSDLQ